MLSKLIYNQSRLQIILVLLGLTAIFLLTYSPSFLNHFPKHPDEWGHINQALNLEQGKYQFQNLSTFGLGFHLFLYGINQTTDLVQIYKFLAPSWAVLSAIILFSIVYSLSGKKFLTAFLSLIFFGSIKSNINLLGLHFFTPLTFAIPFIFLFIFFFIRGLDKKNKKYLLLSFLIMLFLTPVHAISVTFSFPVLIFSGILYYKYIKKEFRFFIIFLLIPLVGLFFLSFVKSIAIIDSLFILVKGLQFSRWESEALAYGDSLTTTYSIAGGILAGIGLLVLLWSKKKELYPYSVWPLYLLLMIIVFWLTDTSYLSPYHRNFYYFTISLPLLSAFGLNWLISFIAGRLKRVNFNLITVSIIFITMPLFFIPHNETFAEWSLITAGDYRDLIFLAEFPKGKILTLYPLSLAVTPITGHELVEHYSDKFSMKHATKFFTEDEFFIKDDCRLRNAMIEVYNIDYVISEQEIFCGYELLRREHNYIYEVRSISRK